MKKSKHTLAEFEVTDDGKTESRLFGKHLTPSEIRNILILYDGYSHKVVVNLSPGQIK